MIKLFKRIAAMGAAVMMMASISAMGASANTVSENSGKAGPYSAGSQNRITRNSGQAITTLSTIDGVTWVKGDYKVQVMKCYTKSTVDKSPKIWYNKIKTRKEKCHEVQ